MPELMTAWVTLAASTKGMERDVRQAIKRAAGDARIQPKVDTREADTAGRRFMQRFSAASGSSAQAGGRAVGSAFVGGFSALLAGGALVAVAQTAVDQVRGVLEEGMDFSRTMNNFQGVTRASAAEMAQMQSAAKALGSDTNLAGASASSAALAMTELAKAGFTVDESIRAARGTLQLATAGQIDAAQAAEIQANAMNAYGLSAESAAHTADLLANAAIASSADIPDLGLALQQVGGIAHGFGVSLDDTIAALGMFANAGVKGSDAGTLLKTTMQSITDQGNPAQAAIQTLNLELYKLTEGGDRQFVGFRELFRQLDEAKKRMSSEEFQAQTNILFGSDAMRSAMLGNAASFDEMFTKLQRVGAAGEMASAQMQGLPGAVEGFKNTVEGIRLDAFESLGPAAAQILGDLVNIMDENKAEIVDFFVLIGESAVTMSKVVLSSLGSMAGIAGDVAGFFGFDEWSQSLHDIEDVSFQAFGALDDGMNKIRLSAERFSEASKFTDALGDSVSSLKMVGNDVTIDVKDNTPEVRAKLDAFGAKLVAMENDPTRLRIEANTTDADRSVNAYRQQQQGTPIEIPLSVRHQPGQDVLPAWFKYIGGELGPAPLPVAIGGAPSVLGTGPSVLPPAPRAPGQTSAPQLAPGLPLPPGVTVPRRATGGLFDGLLPANATLQPARGSGLVQWAEAGTGGEAFIPIKGDRQRSLDIWAQTGRLLGAFDRGGFSNIDAAVLANVPAGQYTQSARGDLTQGLADCSSAVEDLVNLLDGRTTAGASMSTGNAAEWLAARGFIQGTGGLGDMRVAFNSGHMQATLPGGTPFNWGSAEAAARGGVGGSGADDPSLTSRWYRPANLGAMEYAATPYGYSAVDPEKVADAHRRVRDAEADLAIQEQQVRELKADASESQRMSAEDQVRRAREDRDEALRELEEARRGEPLSESDLGSTRTRTGSGTGGGMDASSLGSSFVSGMLEAIGLDGSVFSNPLEWPNVKSGMAALNWGGGLIKGLLTGGGEDAYGAPLGSGGPSLPGINLPGVSDFIKPLGAQSLTPKQPNIAAGVGTGPAPGPLVQYNGPVHMGVDPRAATQRQDAHMNQAWRRNLGSVRPGGR